MINRASKTEVFLHKASPAVYDRCFFSCHLAMANFEKVLPDRAPPTQCAQVTVILRFDLPSRYRRCNSLFDDARTVRSLKGSIGSYQGRSLSLVRHSVVTISQNRNMAPRIGFGDVLDQG